MTNNSEPRTAATVVLLRDGKNGPETLLLQRNKAVQFAGGMWVFPGGSLDPEDWEQGDNEESKAARIGAAREAGEESGLDVDPELMVQISHWTTPEAEPKRFYTWFFLALVADEPDVAIDHSEITDHLWINVDEAVQRHESNDLGLFPPTIMTLRRLQGFLSAEDAMIDVAAREPVDVFPVFARTEDGMAVMFRGDAGYDTSDASTPGARHRAVIADGIWRYQYEGLDPADEPRLDGA